MTIANKFPLGSGAGGILGPKQTLEDMYVRYCIEQNYDPDEHAIAIVYQNGEMVLIADISPSVDIGPAEFGIMRSNDSQYDYVLTSSFSVRALFELHDNNDNPLIRVFDGDSSNNYYADGWTGEAYLFNA